MYQLFHPLKKNWVIRSPPYFAEGILWMTPKILKFLWKSDEWFLRNFLKPKIFFQSSPFTGGPDAKINFEYSKAPNCTKKIKSPDLPFWRYKGSKFQISHLLPKIRWSDPLHILHRVSQGWPRKTLKVLWKSREQFPRYSAFYSPTLSPTYKKRLLERSHYRYYSTARHDHPSDISSLTLTMKLNHERLINSCVRC